MPMFEYECQVCKERMTAVRSISERNDGPLCCGLPTEKRIFTASSFVAPDWNMGYKCVATGQNVSSERQRKRIMDENNLVDAREVSDGPNLEQMQEQSARVKESAAQEVPAELAAAMRREGYSDLL